ncbi:unnamed protein product [Ectocarpus sp. 4 AP-2014]
MSGASPSPPDSSLDEATEEGFILASINTLLNRVGISAKPINSFEELRKSASSMFVAIFEAMFQVRQRGVVRKPAHVHNYVHNAQMVVDALAGPILNMDLSHITGEAIVRGDTVAIRNLVDIFMGISEVVIKRQARPDGGPAAQEFWAGSRRRLKARQGQPQLQQQQNQAQHHGTSSHPPPTAGRFSRHGQQHTTPVSDSGRGDREHGLRVRPPRHEGLQESDHDGLDESLGRSDLSPFRGETELKSSPSGEALTARDILEAHRMFEERGGGFERREDVDVHQGPLRGEQLGLDRRVNRQEEDREMKYRRYYQRVLKDRLTALRKRELADARNQRFAHQNATHVAKVRQIKKERLEEKLRLARLSQRLHLQDEGRGRLSDLYKKILTALHRQRKEDDREDAARLKALHLAWQAQSDDLEKFFKERVELIVEHEQGSGRERAQTMASEERELSDLFRRAEMDYEARLSSQLEQQAVEAAAEERYHAEVQHAYKELLHMEDWSGASRDRFLGVRPNTAFEQRLKQASESNNNFILLDLADTARSRMKKERKHRDLNRAYGRAS